MQIDVAVFYAADDRLEKYAVEPVVAKINQPLPVGIDGVVRSGKHDPFAPRRAADTTISVLSYEDVRGEGRCSWRGEEAPSFPVAQIYLRGVPRNASRRHRAETSLFWEPTVTVG